MEKDAVPRLWSLRSVRLRIALLLLAALCIEGLMRSNLNMAMVCMINRTAVMELEAGSAAESDRDRHEAAFPVFLNLTDDDSISPFCRKLPQIGPKSYHGDLVWTNKQQAWIFSSFYIGGLFIVIPGSYLIDRFGATHVVQGGAILNVVCTLLTPVVSRTLSAYALMVIRFLMGCGQGVLVPCMSVLIAAWYPLHEKSTAVAIATAGNQLSIIFAMVFTAEMCQLPILDGWPSAFYLDALFGVGLCIGWYAFVKDVPTRVKRITDAELTLITGSADGRGQKRITPAVPWVKILKSPAVWSTAMSSFSQSFAIVGTVTYLPLYYRTVLNMDLRSNGIVSALPFVTQLVTKVIFAGIADKAKERRFGVNCVTKVCNLVASLGAAVCFIALLFLDCNDQWKAVCFVCLAMGILSGYVPGYNTSIVCIAPRYTSSIASFCRLWGTISSVASPYLIGILIDKSTLSEWQVVFALMIAVLVSTGILFQLFGSATVQSWATEPTAAISANELSEPLAERKQ